jgi:hypothetical protein
MDSVGQPEGHAQIFPWWNLEVSMQDYEIRVLNKSSAPSINYAATFFNDDAAIRSARSLAKTRPFEVWRGLDRIYRSNAVTNATPLERPVA